MYRFSDGPRNSRPSDKSPVRRYGVYGRKLATDGGKPVDPPHILVSNEWGQVWRQPIDEIAGPFGAHRGGIIKLVAPDDKSVGERAQHGEPPRLDAATARERRRLRHPG